jgi:type III restriction enzyme
MGELPVELKDYQEKVLERLNSLLSELKTQYAEKEEFFAFQQSRQKEAVHPEKSDYPAAAWQALKAKIVLGGDYKPRFDGLGRTIPNVCFKVPTGGGKTLLAAAALQRLNQDYFYRNTGMVLWIVPSETIYTQTLKQLCDREHPYRHKLDKASGGRTLILEKGDRFTQWDVKDNLCIMLMMQQSINANNKEGRRVFRDSGRFESFFPEVDDYTGNNALLGQVKNLETADLLEGAIGLQGVSVKHSLGNVLRLVRPIVILDEGHRATSPLALATLESLNPHFILELSATPKANSNLLCNVGGVDLKKEQMIKLPINVASYTEQDWKHTLNNAHKKLLELGKGAETLQETEGRYVRPLMVIKAEPKKKEDTYDHVSEIKSYLIDILDVPERQIRIKLSENDEIGTEDLLHQLCEVRYIITKEALKEGWDCSFAYVLAILAKAKSKDALTQLIGRVMRQPHARATGVEELNQCYVYCNNTDVDTAANAIKTGLENEGMGDVASDVKPMAGGNNTNERERVTLKRNPAFADRKIFLPTLNVQKNGTARPFEYYRDIMAEIDWGAYFYVIPEKFTLNRNASIEEQAISLDLQADSMGMFNFAYGNKSKEKQAIGNTIDFSLMASQLMVTVANPWHAARIIHETLAALKKQGSTDGVIIRDSVFIVGEIKKDAARWMLEKSEVLFREKLAKGEIFLKLLASPLQDLNWEMLDTMTVWKDALETPVHLDKNIFTPQYRSNYNGYELNIASYINKSEAVQWWHRLAVKGTEYHVQGWKRDRIYPDFLIKLEADNNGNPHFYFLETKGDHLKGSDDTIYKEQVFDCLNQYARDDITPVGTVQLVTAQQKIDFHLLVQDEANKRIRELLG